MEPEIAAPPNQKNQLLGIKAVESPNRGVLCLDEIGIVRFANRRLAEMFGTSVDEIVGLRYSDLVRRLMDRFSEPERFLVRSMDLLEQGSAAGEDVFETLDGGRALHRYSTAVVGKDGRPEGRVEIYSDITFRRRLEREIVERNRELARLNEELRAAQEQLVQSEKLRVLGEMAAGVAHDLNNVLGAVLANVQLLMRREDAATLHEGLESIELAVLDGAETVRRIKELATVGGDRALVPVDLSEAVGDVIRVMQPTWQKESPGPRIEIATDLQRTPGVLGNPAELREALANIILNAVQAMPDGGLIRLATGMDGRGAFVSVSDSGVGMSEDTKRRLFDPFFTTRGAEGTGLGMSIVYAIVTRHGGQVEVSSEEGEGTQVTVVLPAQGAAAAEGRGQPPDICSHQPVRVLIAYGEEVLGTVIAEMLAEAGHEGVAISSPAVFQSCSVEDEFDVILVDEAMLDEVPESLRRRSAVVVLSAAEADPLTSGASRGSDSGRSGKKADLVLTKPVKMDELLAVVRKVVKGRGSNTVHSS